ncbi:ABC transporter ATP-binding protein [Microvirga subterranea]|uniref:NitT/TauT family transport system ATP-binding protein n=1 Tax=Microvirga subterranea TaxID=186651 RepID=A0A370HRN0_9HYPH|nr:ATP-binding cassette domain-containing protein [Microvirga subterranea]RDI61203.1 NitT/TauT family transport system ATP-binding protein [Microvirga subterranea]
MSLKIDVVRKIYARQGDTPERVLFEGLSLELADGEVCALVGPSGTGKTSLLQMVAGLDEDFTGTIEGRPPDIGYLFQTPRLFPWRTARQNLELVLPGRVERAGELLAEVGLAGSEDVYPQRLSLGMARRVALARALAVEPKLLLLDEPFASLDTATSKGMQDLVSAQLQRSRPTTLLVTHHWHEAAALADRIVVIDGSPARIVENRAVLRPRAAE